MRETQSRHQRICAFRRWGVVGVLPLALLAVDPIARAQPAMVAPEVAQFAEEESGSADADGTLRPEQRLKQQGQEPHYRIEGVPQQDINRADAEDEARRGPGPGEVRQDTGIADPTVNPGQARRMETIEGTVLRQEDGRYVIAGPEGKETRVLVDDYTTGDKDLASGDHIAATITPQGRAVMITKPRER